MKKIDVKLKDNPYAIYIGYKILSKLPAILKKLDLGKDAIIITNPAIERLHGSALAAHLNSKGFTTKILTVPDGERSKSTQMVFDLINKIAYYDVRKNPFIIALGGGVIGDLAGFVASIYKRGIPFIQIPTTLLAQIDSAIGGKVGVDLAAGKNLVGSFYQPRLVYSDVAVLSTLNQHQMRNGMAEAVKYGIIYDKALFNFIEKNYEDIVNCRPVPLVRMITECAKIKTEIVIKDEKDTKGLRAILNFGHTFGHAVEAASGYEQYLHGEAVALGMRMACEMSCQLKMLKQEKADKIEKLLDLLNLPKKFKGIAVDKILAAMQHDKKFKGGRNRFVLALDIGKVKLVDNVPHDTIERTLRRYTESLISQ